MTNSKPRTDSGIGLEMKHPRVLYSADQWTQGRSVTEGYEGATSVQLCEVRILRL